MNALIALSRARRAVMFLFTALIVVPAHASHLIDWVCVDIGAARPGSASGASAVTNRGDVTGFFGLSAHAFLWQNGIFRDLGTPPGTFEAFANDMTIDDRIVGIADQQAVMWKDGVWTRLGFRGEAQAIARSGDIAANVVVGGVERGVLVHEGVSTDIGSLTGVATVIRGMNDASHIVGRATLADESVHAFLWANGDMRDLGSLGVRNSFATAINNHDVVVGVLLDDFLRPRSVSGFVWYGQMFPLLSRFSGVFPTAINDRSDIVGRIDAPPGGAIGRKAFLLADGELVRLDDLPAVHACGLSDLFPKAISERRWIVGSASTASGQAHAFLLMPEFPVSPIH